MNNKIKSFTLSKIKHHSALRNEFVILPFNKLMRKLNADENPESHFKNKFYTFLLFKNVSGEVIIDNQRFALEAEKFFFINYNQFYHFKTNENIEGYALLFTKSFYNYVYTGNTVIKSDTALNNVSPCIELSDKTLDELFKIFDELNAEYEKNSLLKKEIICLLLKVFVLKYIRYSNKKSRFNKSVTHKKEIAEEYNNLVNENYKELKTTSQYAEKLHLTANYLNVLIKENFDISAGQLIKNRVILEAKRLLLNTTLSITQISSELGFNDNSHFGKYFKSATQYSPNQYRLEKTRERME